MCRLFGLTAGTARVRATFWLIDAPDSLRVQSHRNVDGAGIGFFDPAGEPVLDKQPEAAFRDRQFTHQARDAESSSFVAHVRFATTGDRTVQNTHPFAMAGRIMAHNGGFGELAQLDAQLGAYRDLVQGQTDSERYFALITQQIDAHDGDVGAGITAAARWIADRLPVSSLNAVVTAPGELWALRYPDQHALHVLERPAGSSQPAAAEPGPGPGGAEPGRGGAAQPGREGAAQPGRGGAAQPGRGTRDGLHARSSMSSVHAPELSDVASVIVASERLDGESGWRMLAPGELVHVRPDLSVNSEIVIPQPPAHLVPLPPNNPNDDS